MSQFANRAGDAGEQLTAYTSALIDLLGGRAPIDVLRDTPPTLAVEIASLPPEVLGVPEAPGKWSIRQVVQHLADSELMGGVRFRMVLAHDRPAIMAYDQDLWADRLHYDQADVAVALNDFATLRRANLRVLEGTSEEERARVGLHSERGEESVARMMQLYAGHDLAHLRQIRRIRAAVGAS